MVEAVFLKIMVTSLGVLGFGQPLGRKPRRLRAGTAPMQRRLVVARDAKRFVVAREEYFARPQV